MERHNSKYNDINELYLIFSIHTISVNQVFNNELDNEFFVLLHETSTSFNPPIFKPDFKNNKQQSQNI